MKPLFKPGQNIAMKVPAHEYESTIAFYRDILGFGQIMEPTDAGSNSVRFEFGDKILWIDCMDGISQAEIWLEVLTDNIDLASEYLDQKQCVRRDEIEVLPEGFEGFWLSNPANIIHLVTASDIA